MAALNLHVADASHLRTYARLIVRISALIQVEDGVSIARLATRTVERFAVMNAVWVIAKDQVLVL